MSGYRVDAKVVLLGREFSGKTSLIERYLHNRYADELPYQSTIGAAYGAKRTEAFGRSVVLGIWDTAGSERYQAMSRIYYRDAWAALLCYDLTSSESWDKVRYWVSELLEYEPNALLYFVGTKKDIVDADSKKREVDFYTVAQFANANGGGPVFETSARTGDSILEVFDRVAKDYVKSLNNPKNRDRERDALDLESIEPKSRCPC